MDDLTVEQARVVLEQAGHLVLADWIPGRDFDLEARLRAVERDTIVDALRRSQWTQKHAATLVGMSARMMGYKVRVLGITIPATVQPKRKWRLEKRSA